MIMGKESLVKAAQLVHDSKFTTVFTGAGISVESGIPPFRGADGLWSKYDPKALDLGNFYANPLQSWLVIKEIFYDFMGTAKPNQAHQIIARLQSENLVHCVVTQNIDNLHQEAGSVDVIEFHGNSKQLISLKTKKVYSVSEVDLEKMPPLCPDGGLLKPNFIFFGENIPFDAYQKSMQAASRSGVLIIIGTTGEVSPANNIPRAAKQHGAKIIEINTEKSLYTQTITDVFLKGKASEMMSELEKNISLIKAMI